MRLAGFARRDLLRNPRRTLASLVGVIVGVGLFSAVLFFVDGSGASMTRRAVAPLALDMQRVLTAPLGGGLRLERTLGAGSLAAGAETQVTLTVRNEGVAAAHEVVLRDRVGKPLAYRPDSSAVDGRSVPDASGSPPFARGAAATGLNIGTVEPGRTRTLTYRVWATEAVPATGELPVRATVSSREVPTPARANLGRAMALGPLAEEIRKVPGVAGANPLAFVSLPGEVTSGGVRLDGPVKLFSFDAAYQANYPSIRVLSGGIRDGGVALSAELARDLRAAEGATVTLDLPGGAEPLVLPVTGVTDLSGARPLFESREWRRFEQFVYAPYAVIVDAATYADRVVPAFARAVAEIPAGEAAPAAVPAPPGPAPTASATASPAPGSAQEEGGGEEGGAEEGGAEEGGEEPAPGEEGSGEEGSGGEPAPGEEEGRGGSARVTSTPFEEVDILVDRPLLDADPATALAQSRAIAEAVQAIAPGEDYLIDNLSNTLSVAAGDARIAKRMFVFLGLPGAIVAALLTAYAGALLAGAQRRETALLRVRGASRRHLMFLLALRTAALAGVGSLLGTALGFAAVLALLGPDILFEASAAALLTSAAIGLGGGMAVTALALYVPGRRLVRREIGAVLGAPPRAGRTWRRAVLELLALAGAAGAQVAALRAGAFDGPAGSVYSGRSVSLPLHLLVAPIVAWLAGTFLVAHLMQAATARSATARGARRFTGLLRGVLWRSITRRLPALAGGVVTVALVVALGTMLACFATAYDRAEADDARFGVGSDIRLTPNPTSDAPRPAALAGQLAGDGIAGATPVVFAPENASLSARGHEDVTALAAVDPAAYPAVAALPDGVFAGVTAADAMRLLRETPDGVLVNEALAASLKIATGEQVEIVFGRGEDEPVRRPARVLGMFTSFPGEPRKTGLVGNLTYHQQVTGKTDADYWLVAAADRTPAGIERAVQALRAAPGLGEFDRRFDVATSEATLDKDKSSLTALNVRGLLHLDSFFTFLMAATATAMFVFGLLMQRRREYVTMRAQGMHAREVRRLVLAESGISAALGAAVGVAVGIAMAGEFVRVLRPIFTLAPTTRVPVAELAQLAGLVLAATALAAVAASVLVNRLRPTELLRDE